MAPRKKNARGKAPATHVSDTASSNVGENAQGELLLAMRNMMKEINKVRAEMEAHRKEASERHSEHTSSRRTKTTSSRQAKTASSRQTIPVSSQHTKHTSSRKTGATISSVQPKTSDKKKGPSMTDKLAKFKKFAPSPFKEAKKPEEAEEWLNELERILTSLQTNEEDMVPFAEFLLQGEANEWWKVEKTNFTNSAPTWKDFREKFLHNYFPRSVWEQKEREFLYLKQGNLTILQYNSEFRKLSRFAPSLVASEQDRIKRFHEGLRPIMQKDLATSKFTTYAELLDTALKLEQRYNQLHAYHNQGEKKRARPENQKHNQKSDERNKKRGWNDNQKSDEQNKKKNWKDNQKAQARDRKSTRLNSSHRL